MPKALSPLVVRFGRLGDMILLQPLLQRLHRRFGRPCTLLSRGAWSLPLYTGHTDVERVIQLRNAHQPLILSPERWRAILRLRDLSDSPVYVCEPEPRALAKARRMLTLAGISQRNCIFLGDMPMRDDEHWVDRLLRFAARIPDALHGAGYPAADTLSAAPTLQLREADHVDCSAWLDARGWNAAPLVLLQPANKRSMRWNGMRGVDDDKWWPIEHWAALARAIRAAVPDSRVLLCGASREASLLHTIRNATADARVHVVADELPLRRLMALQAIAHSMISVDTGPAHLAAALGCPLVVLFGKASLAHWLPRGGCDSKVLALGGSARGGRVDAISVDEVVATWRRLPFRRSPQFGRDATPDSGPARASARSIL
jgi:ADP-heptose:LPS heptosyltransferase